MNGLSLGPYPTELLEGAGSALFLFGAGFLGANDAGHAAAAGVPSTVVDIDEAKLEQMRGLYPDDWEFVRADAFDYIAAQRGRRRWDLVSVDPFLGSSDLRCQAILPGLLELTNGPLVLGCARLASPDIPAGWDRRLLGRSSRASWLVLTAKAADVRAA